MRQVSLSTLPLARKKLICESEDGARIEDRKSIKGDRPDALRCGALRHRRRTGEAQGEAACGAQEPFPSMKNHRIPFQIGFARYGIGVISDGVAPSFKPLRWPMTNVAGIGSIQ